MKQSSRGHSHSWWQPARTASGSSACFEKAFADPSVHENFGLRSKIAQKLRELSAIHLRVRRNPHCKAPGCWGQELFTVGMGLYAWEGWKWR